MGIYKANSFNPITSIQAGLREATERGKLAGDKYRADADFWKGATEIGQKFADDMGKVGLNAYDMYVEQNDTPEARLAALEAELAEAKYNEQVRQRNDVNDYLMSGRVVPAYNDNRGFSMVQEATNSMDGYTPTPDMNEYSMYLNAIKPGIYRR
jgi:hypothetical protein